MTLYYGLVFVVLISEMFLFLLLVAPLPAMVHTNLIRSLRSPIATKLISSMKYLFLFILVLFIDSANRTYRVPVLGETASISDRSDFLVKKFYNQRNLYLCGFTLFLSFILNRTFKLVKLNSDYKLQLGDSSPELSLKAQDYKDRLERKKKQFKALEEQSEGLRKEYFRVSDELAALKGTKRSEESKKAQ